LLEDAQLKKALRKSRQDTHKLQASGSSKGADFESEVPDESKAKPFDTSEGTGVKPGVLEVSKANSSNSDNESWGNSKDESDDVNDDDNANDDDNGNEDDDGNDAHDSERTDSDDDENPSFTLKDYEEEEHDEEYVHSPENYESDDDKEDVHEEEDDDLYKDVDVKSLRAEHEKERKGDAEMTDADQNVSQEKSYEQVVEDAHVTLTSSQKTKSLKQSSSVSSDFASKFLILDNVPPVIDEVASMMNVKIRQEESSTQAPSLFTVPETAIPETSTSHTTTVPPTISMITPLPQLTTPSPAPTTVSTTTSIRALLNFSSLFEFDQRVSTLEKELSQLKQVDHSAQLLESAKSQIPTIVDDLLSTRIRYATRTALQLYTKEFEKKAQEERKLYIDDVKKSVKDIINDEVKSQLPQILPKEVSDFATLSTYEAARSLIEFELKKILLDKIEKSKSYQAALEHRELYDRLIEDKDEDPPVGSNQRLKKRKTSKDVEPPKDSKSKESKSSSSKGTKPQPKSSSKSTQAEEPVFEAADTEMQQDRGKCYKAVTYQLDWNNPEGHEYPFDLSKLMSLIEFQGRQVVHADYFFNNDLEYLKGGSSSRKYTTSTTKTKAAKYDNIKGIEDMVPTLWSPVKVAYDQYAMWVTHVKVMKWYDYGYLEEIIIRRDDQKLYKFMEGDFPRLNLRDIEDLLLLLVQKKLSNLEKDVIFDLNVALQMFTRRVVILKRVEDLQLGVKSYQKKLNFTKPETFRSDISKMTL
ncbi:hypothetical protein Tco_1009809, partial [Tanacetum coccineum]